MKKSLTSEPPYAELRGRKDLLFDGCEALLEYGENKILLKTAIGDFSVCGSKLKLRFISEKKIAVTGCIRSIGYE